MCYTVPLAGAVIGTILHTKKKSIKLWWLNLMFYGGALFGVIDHLWNGELFLVSENWRSDMFLGIVITFAIIAVWVIVCLVNKASITQYITVDKKGQI